MILLYPAPNLILKGVQFHRARRAGGRDGRAPEILAYGVARQAELLGNPMNGCSLRRQFMNGMHGPTPEHGAPRIIKRSDTSMPIFGEWVNFGRRFWVNYNSALT